VFLAIPRQLTKSFRNLLCSSLACDSQFGRKAELADFSPWRSSRGGYKEGRKRMLQPSDNSQKAQNQNFTPAKTVGAPMEQATIGRSLVIKGEVSGSESLYIDGRIEGTVNIAENRVTIGRNGIVAANIAAREVVIMGKVTGNVQCSDRLDIRGEGTLTGDVVTQRISVEDGAILKGSVQVRAAADHKHEKMHPGKAAEQAKAQAEQAKAASAAAGSA
jgi:cytoskeletal protein CcmA (bactofilin family)